MPFRRAKKIRSQLVLLVIAVLMPTVVLTSAMTVWLWHLQRQAYEQRFLERVSALRLALDTEIEATQRVLRTLAEVPDLEAEAPGRLQNFTARFPRLLANNPAWATIGVVGPDGAPRAALGASGRADDLRLDAASWEALQRTRQPVVSNFVAAAPHRGAITYVAVPVLHGEALRGAVYIGVQSAQWLQFLRRYPVAQNATLTLNDREGVIIARTLNNEKWTGQRSLPGFWSRVTQAPEGAMRSQSLEGEPFYLAYSRLRSSSWVLATGVPQSDVEAALRGPTLLLAGGVLVAAALAIGSAWLLGRRVIGALTGLEQFAALEPSVASTGSAAVQAIDEAESVRVALQHASERLQKREAALAAALQEEGRLRAAAERANAAKDEFLAMLGHELRNPLSAVSTATAVLAGADQRPDLQRRAREIVQRQIHHLTRIINELLDVARVSSGKVMLNKRRTDLAVVVQQVVESFEGAGRCAHLQLATELRPLWVEGDETRLAQVVANLLDNACKYTPAGGQVAIGMVEDAGWAVLTVRDTGPGIGAELLPYVFDVFSQGERTLDRAKGGLGIGLTVVRRLVELHGGTVAALSDGLGEGPRAGSVFVVRLPLADTGALPAGSAVLPLPQPPRRILVVEDNPDIRDSMRLLLTLRGHTVNVAEDGPSGLDALARLRPDIALVDIGLPGFDGMELARRVRIPPAAGGIEGVMLVAVTGYGTEGDRAQALAAGFDAFIVKPFDIAQFEAAIGPAD